MAFSKHEYNHRKARRLEIKVKREKDFAFGQQNSYLEQDAAVGLRLGYFIYHQPVNPKTIWKVTVRGSSGSALTAYFHQPLICGFKHTFYLVPLTSAVCGMRCTGIYWDILSTLNKIVIWINELSVHGGPWWRQSWNFLKVWSFQGLSFQCCQNMSYLKSKKIRLHWRVVNLEF